MNTTLQVTMNAKKLSNTQSKTGPTTRNAQQAFETASSNPFNTQLSANGLTISAKSFTPSSFVPSANKFPLTKNATFLPTSNISCPSEESTSTSEGSQCETKPAAQKYKTELCKNWIENGGCRYGKKCQFAHGKEELATFKA